MKSTVRRPEGVGVPVEQSQGPHVDEDHGKLEMYPLRGGGSQILSDDDLPVHSSGTERIRLAWRRPPPERLGQRAETVQDLLRVKPLPPTLRSLPGVEPVQVLLSRPQSEAALQGQQDPVLPPFAAIQELRRNIGHPTYGALYPEETSLAPFSVPVQPPPQEIGKARSFWN